MQFSPAARRCPRRSFADESDRDSDLGAARFIGLGAAVREARRSSLLTVFLQNCDNGHVVTATREFAEDPDAGTARKPFHQLARAPAAKGASLAGLAAGQLVTQGGRRTASGRLVIGRARAVVNPQNYAWEQLKAPALVEDFAELGARLTLLPAASFRPRREAADFHVCPLDGVDAAAFDPATNCIVAVLRDRSGQQAQLSHAWTVRGETGAEALLAALSSDAKPLFVAGHVRAAGAMLLIRPTAVVFAGAGAARFAVMPWLDATAAAAAAAAPSHPQRSGPGRGAHMCATARQQSSPRSCCSTAFAAPAPTTGPAGRAPLPRPRSAVTTAWLRPCARCRKATIRTQRSAC